ncbi:MAG: ABC transporter permease [Bacteroidales bacterium]|nr:ABC transporter permease [Bacteroidales bacterium]
MTNPIKLIISREYVTRVKKKSFIVMTFLTPLLVVGAYALIIYLNVSAVTQSQKNIMVWDESNVFYNTFKSTDNYKFTYIFPDDLEDAKKKFLSSNNDLLLCIPKTKVIVPESANIFSKEEVGIGVNTFIKSLMKKDVERMKLESSGVSEEVIKSINTEIKLDTFKISETGDEEKSYPEIKMALAFIFSIMIYFFVFMFGSQVQRGVIEEKTNRVIEVMVSTAKPYQLMAGKIIGIALVGLTQFVLWIVFSVLLIAIATPILSGLMSTTPDVTQISQMASGIDLESITANFEGNEDVLYIIESIKSINFTVILYTFLFFFIFGYFFYASLFAAIGAVVDNETDTQQFMLPITIPLIISIATLQIVIENPNGSLAFWLSMIPFTSPITMMTRIPFGIAWWEVILSCSILIISVVGAIWISAKIYRIGILMYGKKATYKDLWKWIKN